MDVGKLHQKVAVSHLFSVSCQFVVISIFYQISMVFILFTALCDLERQYCGSIQDFREVLGVHD